MSKKPFVSLANLVEYATTSSAARRRQIIEQYHNPQVIRFDWHGASDAIFAQRACGSASANHLIDIEQRRIQDQMIGDKDKDKRKRHILHLIELLEASDLVRLTEDTETSMVSGLAADFSIGNLTIRVRPSLVLSRKKLSARYPAFGILKCHNLQLGDEWRKQPKSGERPVKCAAFQSAVEADYGRRKATTAMSGQQPPVRYNKAELPAPFPQVEEIRLP